MNPKLVEAIGKGILFNISLQKLNLSGNNINDEIIQSIVFALQENSRTSINTLDLSNNKITVNKIIINII